MQEYFEQMTPERKRDLMNAVYSSIQSDVNMDRIVGYIAQGIDPAENYHNPDKDYNGNLLHAHANISHSGYGGADKAFVRFMIDSGVDINALNDDGFSPLHIALGKKDKGDAMYECAVYLVKTGADVDLKNGLGETPLHMALRLNDLKSYGMLMAAGADPTIKDARGLDATKAWHKLSPEKISATTIEGPLQYRLTEIFNFANRTYTCISQNMETKAEALQVQSFEALGSPEAVEEAYVILRKEGGTAEYQAGPTRKPGLSL